MNKTISINNLLEANSGVCSLASGNGSTEINSLHYDSRKISSGSLFVAVEGYSQDGHQFVRKAVESGAVAIAINGARAAEFADLADKVAIIAAENTRLALSSLSSAFYGHPSRNMTVIGVTGTNGKTSITFLFEAVLRAQGKITGVIGTIDYRWRDKTIPAPNTTPESADLHAMLAEMLADGVDTVIMEVSSHALELDRVSDVAFDYALFTNLTRDHLDFHKDFEHYFIAKKRLFSLLDSSPKKVKGAVINADDEYGRQLLSDKARYSVPLFGCGKSSDSDFHLIDRSVQNRLSGISYDVEWRGESNHLSLQLCGLFNVYNSLQVYAVCRLMGYGHKAVSAGLTSLPVVPGRFDKLVSPKDFYVLIDYAHTNDALLKILQSVRELQPKRIITVFGCGGDRDKTKRPIMGAVAEEWSDLVYVTSDNPRTENPDAIIQDILAGMKSSKYRVEADREMAIKSALTEAKAGDVVVLAGKGHEDYQIIGKEKIHFSDRETALKYLG